MACAKCVKPQQQDAIVVHLLNADEADCDGQLDRFIESSGPKVQVHADLGALHLRLGRLQRAIIPHP